MGRPAKEDRKNFEAGKVDAWSTGPYGARVRVIAQKGKLKVRFQDPQTGRTRQKTVFAADTGSLRKVVTRVAVEMTEKLRSGVEKDLEREAKGQDLTMRDCVILYLKRFPGFPEQLLAVTAAKLKEWYRDLPESIRKSANVPKEATLISDVYGFRRIMKDTRFRPDKRIVDLEPADATTYFNDSVAAGGSPRTGSNDMDRMSCAINYVIEQHQKTIGLERNPLKGRKVDRTKADIPQYSREERRRLLEAAPKLAAEGQWHVLVATGIASSGRRISAICGLTEGDHDFEAGIVTWRAEEAKGEGYGRGDEHMPMTTQHRKAVLWALECFPNPLGADHPILYQVSKPRNLVPPQTLWGQLMRLEELAGVKHQPSRAWHSFRRAVATMLADEIGDGAASEYIGMTTATLRKYGYKKVQAETMEQAARTVDLKTEGGFSGE